MVVVSLLSVSTREVCAREKDVLALTPSTLSEASTEVENFCSSMHCELLKLIVFHVISKSLGGQHRHAIGHIEVFGLLRR